MTIQMSRAQTTTGGRDAAGGVIRGRVALSVGRPDESTPPGFNWRLLTDLARLESGHTPSRKQPSYWGGDVPWIGVRDATANHGRVISETRENVTPLGIENSSARLLPAETVCLSRTASVGYVVMMGRPMATSQDFVNWVCGPELNPHYLKFILLLEQESVRRFAHGTTHQTMYYPEAKALHVLVPDRETQDSIVAVLGALNDLAELNRAVATDCESLAILLAQSATATSPLGDLAESPKIKPAKPAGQVYLYSLPAYDQGRLPASVGADEIKSSKVPLAMPTALVSRLNPHIPRVWMAYPDEATTSFASTEFVPFTGLSAAAEEVWAACAGQGFLTHLRSLVTGTTGSHQRVDREDMTAIPVPDVRQLPPEFRSAITSCVREANESRQQGRRSSDTLDELLPLLLSARVMVRQVAS